MPTATDNKFIFVHIPKCGGMSVMSALRGAGVRFDFDEVGLWGLLAEHPQGSTLIRQLKSVYPINTINGFPQEHLPAALLRELIPEGSWEQSFSFTFVRNPWDLLVSTYFYIRKNMAHYVALEPDYTYIVSHFGFPDFVRRYPTLLSDMSSMFVDDSGKDLVNFVGRFERLEVDFREVCSRIGLEAKLPHINRSVHENYRSYYDDETKEIVRRHFVRDIERFEYCF